MPWRHVRCGAFGIAALKLLKLVKLSDLAEL